MRFVSVCTVGAMLLAAGVAQAGVTSVNIVGTDIQELALVDGVWNGGYGTQVTAPSGTDWGYVTAAGGAATDRMWVDEDWTQGGDVSLGFTVHVGEDATQFIGLNKRAKNRSGFNWTAFDILLQSTGVVTVDTGTLASPDFSGITVLNNGTPNVLLKFTGGNVGYDQFANFTIDFEIPSGPSWTYTMTQTAIPTPGAIALLGMGGLLAARRRR